MDIQIFGGPVPAGIEHRARRLVLEDERPRGIVTDGSAFEIRATQRVFAGERMVAVVLPVVIEADTDAPVFEIEEG